MSNYGGSSYAQTAPPAHGGAPADSAVPKAFPILAIVGAALALGCTFINWIAGEANGETGGVKGIDGDGVITLILSIVAALAIVGAMVTKKAPFYLGGAILSLVTVVVGVINFADPARLAAQKLEDEGLSSAQAEKYAEEFVKAADMSAAPGLYGLLIGAALTAVFGVLGFMKSRNSR
ncbi:hypothetical protein ACFV1F_45405 [Streptomyces sp. NPDC059590]|uniref:hypothetical protein n=1 Tax=Streptomyces sp. NPDC059590 TaxID=3346877 RepID=UPI0036BA7264